MANRGVAKTIRDMSAVCYTKEKNLVVMKKPVHKKKKITYKTPSLLRGRLQEEIRSVKEKALVLESRGEGKVY